MHRSSSRAANSSRHYRRQPGGGQIGRAAIDRICYYGKQGASTCTQIAALLSPLIMTTDEINAFLADSGKSIIGNIELEPMGGRAGSFGFRQTIRHSRSDNLEIGLKIWFNARRPKITIAYFVPGIDRIYGFCLGVSHNRMRFHQHIGIKGDEQVTPLPDSIAHLVGDPATVWMEFCSRTRLTHTGNFRNPARQPWPPSQQI